MAEDGVAPHPSAQLRRASQPLHAGGPLWKRVPSHNTDGKPLADFMVILPKLSKQPDAVQRDCLNRVQKALTPFAEEVVFADFNFRINVLWISHCNREGLFLDLVQSIQHWVPESRLIANQAEIRVDLGKPRLRDRLLRACTPKFLRAQK